MALLWRMGCSVCQCVNFGLGRSDSHIANYRQAVTFRAEVRMKRLLIAFLFTILLTGCFTHSDNRGSPGRASNLSWGNNTNAWDHDRNAITGEIQR
jgi:hypothetical protein